jgi:hypothetical protein
MSRSITGSGVWLSAVPLDELMKKSLKLGIAIPCNVPL